MFIAMNRFKVEKQAAQQFEDLWSRRDSYLHEVDGFMGFHLLRGPEREDHILYASHTAWRSEVEFLAWTKSDHFRKAHANAGSTKPLYLGAPEFEGFTAVQEIAADGAKRVMRP